MNNAIITGATRGIGRAVATAFALEGVNVAVCARGDAELAELRTELLKLNPQIKVAAVLADGSRKEELLQFAAEAESQLGPIGIVVNNLGAYEPAGILDETEGTFERQLATNLLPAFHLYRFFGKKMQAARHGHLFTICSVAAIDPIAAAGSYSVSKYALLGLCKVMRKEMQAHSVKVTAVIPGSTLTSSWEGTSIAAEQFVLPADVAAAIVGAWKMSAGANVDEIIIRPVGGQF